MHNLPLRPRDHLLLVAGTVPGVFESHSVNNNYNSSLSPSVILSRGAGGRRGGAVRSSRTTSEQFNMSSRSEEMQETNLMASSLAIVEHKESIITSPTARLIQQYYPPYRLLDRSGSTNATQSAANLHSDRQVIYQHPDHFASSFPTFEQIRRQGKLCDVTLKVRISKNNYF